MYNLPDRPRISLLLSTVFGLWKQRHRPTSSLSPYGLARWVHGHAVDRSLRKCDLSGDSTAIDGEDTEKFSLSGKYS